MGVVSVRRQRCHYIYSETSRVGDVAQRSKLVTISEYGSIVEFLDGKVIESSYKCPELQYSIEQLANFLQLNRKRFSDLPPPLKEFTYRAHNKTCMPVLFETPEPHSKGKIRSYVFDYYGDLFDFREMN